MQCEMVKAFKSTLKTIKKNQTSIGYVFEFLPALPVEEVLVLLNGFCRRGGALGADESEFSEVWPKSNQIIFKSVILS